MSAAQSTVCSQVALTNTTQEDQKEEPRAQESNFEFVSGDSSFTNDTSLRNQNEFGYCIISYFGCYPLILESKLYLPEYVITSLSDVRKYVNKNSKKLYVKKNIKDKRDFILRKSTLKILNLFFNAVLFQE